MIATGHSHDEFISYRGFPIDVKELHFWELNPSLGLEFEPSFTRYLFNACGTKMSSLAVELGISYPYALHLRLSWYAIPIRIVVQLARKAKIPLEDIEREIRFIRPRSGHRANISFPIVPSEDLASLVGHVFGDGYIGQGRTQFEYSNNNPNLIAEVKRQISKTFGLHPVSEMPTRITYSTIVGDILSKFGAPMAPKIDSTKKVPQWISESSTHSAAFLRAFFDDDGSVMRSHNYAACGVNLYVIRRAELESKLFVLLEQIRRMLIEQGVLSGNTRVRGYYEKADGLRVVMYLNITNHESIKNFHQFIGLTPGSKCDKLKSLVERNVRGRKHVMKIPKKVLVLGSGALKIGESGEILRR